MTRRKRICRTSSNAEHRLTAHELVPLEQWGPEESVRCKVKFDVADVAYKVVSLGKMIESGFTFSFDDYKCYMHRGNKRVEIFRKGRIFVLRMGRRWLKSTAHIIAPIDEVADEEMGVADDGEGAGGAEAAVEPPGGRTRDDPPPQPRPREVRPSPMRPGAEAVRQHNLIHCKHQRWCEVCVASKGKRDHYHRETPVSKDGEGARVQMDFMFVGAEGIFVDEPRAKATVLMVVL